MIPFCFSNLFTDPSTYVGPALAVDTSDAKGAVESIKSIFKGDKTGAAIGGAVSGEGAAKPGVSVGFFKHCLL